MSNERAKRRAVREHESALRAAARAAEAERRERKRARQLAIRKMTGRIPGLSSTGRQTGRQTGVLARRRRIQRSLLVAALLTVNILVWVVRPDWAARLGVLIVSILAAPVLATLLFRRRT